MAYQKMFEDEDEMFSFKENPNSGIIHINSEKNHELKCSYTGDLKPYNSLMTYNSQRIREVAAKEGRKVCGNCIREFYGQID